MKPLTADHHPDCYPSDPAAALAFFDEAFGSFAAKDIPATPPALAKADLLGVVTPHIDFRVSLRAYSAAFRPLLDLPLADTYIILGVGHRSRLDWNFDRRDFVTPLGTAINAVDLVEALTHGGDPKRFFAPDAHEGEHSIEFALLWLQALHQLHPDTRTRGTQHARPFRFVPLLCGSMHNYVEGPLEWDELGQFQFLSGTLAKLLDDAPGGQTIRVIVSIDGCHLGPRFEHPFRVTPVLLSATEGWEKFLWNQVAAGDARKFLDWFRNEGNDRYFDGVGALSLLLNAGDLSRRGKLNIQRTFYEQWFTERDASAVTFSSGRVLGLDSSYVATPDLLDAGPDRHKYGAGSRLAIYDACPDHGSLRQHRPRRGIKGDQRFEQESSAKRQAADGRGGAGENRRVAAVPVHQS